MRTFSLLLLITALSVGDSSAQTNFAPAVARGPGQDPGIRLMNVDLPTVLKIYSEVAGRTVLRPSALKAGSFSLTNSAGSKAEMASAFEEMFQRRGIAAIHDGEKFVILVPLSWTNSVRPHSAELKSTPAQVLPNGTNGAAVPAGAVNLENLPMRQAVQVYGEFTRRTLLNAEAVPATTISLNTATPLTTAEIAYAFETVFALNGVKIVPESYTSFRIERVATGPH